MLCKCPGTLIFFTGMIFKNDLCSFKGFSNTNESPWSILSSKDVLETYQVVL